MRFLQALFLLVLTVFLLCFWVDAKKDKTSLLKLAERAEFIPTSNNRTIFVSSLTPGKSCAIIFAHGLLESSQVWFNQYITWLPECSTVTFDLYGHGLSTGILPKRDDTVQITDLKNIIQWTQATKIIMVGHNYGGIGIQQYVQKYPSDKRIVALSLVDTFARNPNPYRQGGDQPIIDLLAANTYKQKALVAASLALLNPATPPQLPEGAWEIFAGSGLITNMKAANQIILTNVSFIGSTFSKPVQILYGGDDSIISPENWTEMKSIYKNSTLSDIPTAGHTPYIQLPSQFNEALLRFLVKVTNNGKF